MNTITEEYISITISKIATANNIKDCCYVKQNFETIGQNYFGIIIPVVIHGISSTKEEKISLNLVLKLAPPDEQYRVSDAVTHMFAREIFVYDVMLKKYEEIQCNFPEKSKYVIPYCYYVCKEYCNEVIAMQDMCSDMYKPYTHQRFLDVDHITISLRSLAKLHGLSFILKYQNIKLYEEISKVCVPLTEVAYKRYIDITKDRLCKALEKFENTEYVPLLNYLKLNCSTIFTEAINKVGETCICHGDMWKENVLFKYEGNTPISACLIDYQASRLSSPAFDTLYLIISSTSTHLRQKHYYSLLDLYYQAFEQTLAEAGLVSHNVYSRELFNKDLNVIWPACFIMANTALWLSSGLQEEGHVRSKQILENEEDKNKAVTEYKTIIKVILDDFSTYGYRLPEGL
ncbi:hypothetical protein K1T71_012185 [Dendrolimus kikuchii]|uniref:Uncharacterized protein n=1 Tax=Dendrolimus kikuchii TaxID=765133 RepID=A0ACC1CL46_9NEOP|nr:hypothetical protein K1T71_012185 [Dendrolimus kikuchii]